MIMKIQFTSVFILLFLTAHGILAQQPKAAEPDYIGIFNYLDVANNKLTPLERQTVQVKAKAKAFGFGGAEGYVEIKGDRSSVRFKANDDLYFVVRASSQQVDPSTVIQFFMMQIVKGARQLKMVKVSAFGAVNSNKQNESMIPFNTAKYGESSFKIVPSQGLPMGEYCFSTTTGQDAFCFGIDAADPNKIKAAAGSAKKYLSEKNSANYLELKPDGTFLLNQNGAEATGEYKASGDVLMLKMAGGKERTIALYGDAIVDDEGEKWIKEGATSSTPTQSVAPGNTQQATVNNASGSANNTSTEVLTNDDILEMVKAGIAEKTIITTIKQSKCRFDTGSKTLIKLKQAGISDAVIQAMVESPKN